MICSPADVCVVCKLQVRIPAVTTQPSHTLRIKMVTTGLKSAIQETILSIVYLLHT